MKFLLILLVAATPLLSQTGSGCTTNTAAATGTVQSYGLCNPLVIDGRLKGGWIALNRTGDQSNSETQCYSPGNVVVANGFLTEVVTNRSKTCHYYPATGGTSSLTQSFDSAFVQWNTYSFTGGDIQIRMKGPSNVPNGGWPALWLLGANCEFSSKVTSDNTTFNGLTCNWPSAGSEEIDIFEQQGATNGLTNSNCNLFSSGGNVAHNYTISNSSQGFHIYELRWVSGTSLTWLYDGTIQAGCTITSATVPSNPMFLQMNIAMVSAATSTGLPSTMQIDWVKVCQPSPCNGNGGNITFYDDFVTGVATSVVRPASRLARLAALQQSTNAVMVFRAEADRPKKKIQPPKVSKGELQ